MRYVLFISEDGKTRNLEELPEDQFQALKTWDHWNVQCRQLPDGSVQWMASPKSEARLRRDAARAAKLKEKKRAS